MVFGGYCIIIVRLAEVLLQKIIVHLRHWMPLLALFCVTMCAWDVSPRRGRPHGGDDANAAGPRITVNIAARQLYLYDKRAALVKTSAAGCRFPALPHPDSCAGHAHDCVECLVDASPQPVGSA